MFRAQQVSVMLKNGPILVRCVLSKHYEIPAAAGLQSNISKKYLSSKDDGNKVCDEKGKVKAHPSTSKSEDPAKVKLKQCNPVDISPCKPDPTPYRKIPSIRDCPTPNMMNDLPKPGGSWQEQHDKAKKRGRTILLMGLLFTAAAIGSLYYVGLIDEYQDTKKKKKPEKVKSKTKFRDPPNSAEIPKQVPYLLIGGGTASFAAFRAIKSSDPTAKVLVITEEPYFPYMRPPLSKEIWFGDDKESVKKLLFKQWNGSERSLFYEPDDFYTPCKDLMNSSNGGVSIARGWSITHLDVRERLAYLDDGSAINYEKCLLATGATPRLPAVFQVAVADERLSHKIKLFRNISDFEEVYDGFENAKSIAIVGGGFLGSELACAFGRKGKKDAITISQIFREDGNMGKILPEYLSLWTTNKVKAEGVKVIPNSEVVGIKTDYKTGQLQLMLNNDRTLNTDFVLVAAGVEPNTELAAKSDLEVDPDLGGFLVNTELQARTDLYIAGDCACFYDPRLGRRRIEHHDHAVVSGRLAGENMTGARKPYYHQSMFWSDLGPDVGYEAIGIVDSKLPTVGVFAKATSKDSPQAAVTDSGEGDRSRMEEVPRECDKYMTEEQKEQLAEARKLLPKKEMGEDFGKGVIFYLRDDIVVGIVLWNVFNRMSIARQVLKDQKKYDDLNEVAKLFNIHEEEPPEVEFRNIAETEEKEE